MSEIGDKTFFIAALLAMRLGRAVSFVGSVAALSVMTVISVGIGAACSKVPDALKSSVPIGEIAGVILLVVFGIRALRVSGWCQGGGAALRSAACCYVCGCAALCGGVPARVQRCGGAWDGALLQPAAPHPLPCPPTARKPPRPPAQPTTPPTPRCPQEAAKPADVESASESELADAQEVLQEAESTGKVSTDGRDAGKLASLAQVATLIFLAEWGDRSMLATIALGAAQNPVGVAVGATVGHCIATAIAVVGGGIAGKHISERGINLASGLLFLIFAAATVYTML